MDNKKKTHMHTYTQSMGRGEIIFSLSETNRKPIYRVQTRAAPYYIFPMIYWKFERECACVQCKWACMLCRRRLESICNATISSKQHFERVFSLSVFLSVCMIRFIVWLVYCWQIFRMMASWFSVWYQMSDCHFPQHPISVFLQN